MRELSVVLGATLFLLGCVATATIEPYRPRSLGTERVFDKNYEKNVEHTVYVGEPVIRVKDYYTSKTARSLLVADRDVLFRVPTGLDGVEFRASAGEVFPIDGERVIEGKRYLAFTLVGQTTLSRGLRYQLYFAEPENEVLKASPNARRPETRVLDVVASPPKSLSLAVRESVDTTTGFVSFELLYAGMDRDSIHLTYREYTPDDLIRPAYTQAVRYAADAETIRFRKILMDVVEASNETLTVIVRVDGL